MIASVAPSGEPASKRSARRCSYRHCTPVTYPKGIKVSEEQMAALNLKGDEFHPDWNYSISPRGQIVEP
jgi:Rhodopirellula transposase DDE domain